MKKSVSIVLIAGLAFASAAIAAEKTRMTEDYARVPMPPGIQVLPTEVEGPVFADAQGKTIYTWPQQAMRSGFSGDPKDKSACEDKPTLKTAGMMSPYPPGLDLPELDRRLSCAATWPPVLAPDGAKPVGKWSVITRSDGKKQWAYDDHAVYTSILDKAPGDVIGGNTGRRGGGDTPAEREPLNPPPNVPPGFNVVTTVRGRMVVNDKRYSVYTYDKDGPNKSNCTDDCARTWIPMVAPASAQPQGEWSVIQRSPAVRQWAFRKKPVYTFSEDQSTVSQNGSDMPGWHNVYAQLAPKPPAGFTTQETFAGDVLADAKGMTIYYYTCGDDSQDQMSCDTMDSPQVYRIAVAGGGNWDRALKMWPYVVAAPGVKSDSRIWSIVDVDPKTGRRATAGQAGSLRVWAYRDRPVYTYAGDKAPGDLEGNATGEWQGRRNGFRAFYLRDEFAGRG
jgi:predicted lipoprotein with Yx(FWY)xxD motif